MKRFVLALAAASFLIAPAAYAADRKGPSFPSHHGMKYQPGKPFKAESGRTYRKHEQRKQRWSKGQRVPAWQRGHVVRDYHRYGLRRPGHGQQWVKVGNDYVLIAIASGIIANFLAR
ncbi:MAG: RcnB family protein [Rhizobiaceae bacterium]